jgi:pimeloyl-ACP methyl ester carboxylesterase
MKVRTFFPLFAGAMLIVTGCDKSVGDDRTAVASDDSKPAKSQSAFADVDGVRIAYQIHGDLKSGKTPLFVLHGSMMSGASMGPFVEEFVRTRPIVTVDARGHGQTGDVPGAITYEMMADDAAAVARSLGLKKIDVFGWSMGGTTAILMAVRHPEMVDKQIVLSAPSRRGGWYPQVQAGFEKWRPEMFAGSPVERQYRKESATPNALPALVDKMRVMESTSYDVTPAELRAIPGKTMIIVGDADGVALSHAIELFEGRGGRNMPAALQGFVSESPKARLAILPATGHIAMLNEAHLIARYVAAFLDDHKPAPTIGFFEGMDKPAGKSK